MEKQLIGVRLTFANGATRTVNLLVDEGEPDQIRRQIADWTREWEPSARSWEWI